MRADYDAADAERTAIEQKLERRRGQFQLVLSAVHDLRRTLEEEAEAEAAAAAREAAERAAAAAAGEAGGATTSRRTGAPDGAGSAAADDELQEREGTSSGRGGRDDDAIVDSDAADENAAAEAGVLNGAGETVDGDAAMDTGDSAGTGVDAGSDASGRAVTVITGSMQRGGATMTTDDTGERRVGVELVDGVEGAANASDRRPGGGAATNMAMDEDEEGAL